MLTRQYNLSEATSDDSEYTFTEAKKSPNKEPAMPPRKKSLCQGLKETYFEFCSNTSIHGFQYFGQQRPLKEILFWIGVFVVTIYFCSSIIVKIYLKWSETPVIVSFSEKSTPIWNIPFPAVTICPESKRTMKKTDPSYHSLELSLEAYIEGGQEFQPNFTSHELHEILTLMHICNLVDIELATSPTLPPIDYIQILNDMLTDFELYFSACEWFGKEAVCDDIFTKVYTDEGICFTFNSLRGTDIYREDVVQHQMSLENSANYSETINGVLRWSLEQGYGKGRDLHTYPARVLSSGGTAGLLVYLQSFLNEVDYTCSGPIQGFKVLLHSPDDVPSVVKHFVRIPMDREILIAVKPKMITTSADIAAYHPDKRRCYLNKDRQLKFFKFYSQNNCERECLTNFTLNACGCVKFSMPRTPDMPVCAADKISCYSRAREQLLLKQFSEGLTNSDFTSGDGTECNCMPACTSLEYETEISEGTFDLVNTFKAFNEMDDYFEQFPGGKMSLLSIYFKENQFITSRRSELYGVTELLANFGGVFGLFMGISILSLVEMLYHFSLRLWSTMTRPRDVN